MKRTGFSLVEIVVVVAIISVLTAILFPAVQSAREAASRTSCANNLRQIGVALANYHTSFEQFPVGCLEWRSTDPAQRQLAWNAFLLPFLEQESLHAQIDFDQAYDSIDNRGVATQTLRIFRCPSSQRIQVSPDDFGLTDYGGVFGERITSPNQPPKGVMLIDEVVAVRDISDGLSSTLIIAEDSKSSQGEWINGANIFDQAFPINAGPDFENDIRSDHPGGANAIFCDGSVRFFANNMGLQVLAAHCTRAGQEIVSELGVSN